MFSELKGYVGWGPEDEETLRSLKPLLAPSFPGIVDCFYEQIQQHPRARAALTGGEQQLSHLKVQLARWLDTLLSGPWDEAYVQQRARVGRMHVRVGLPQHYMFSAMNVIRRGLLAALDAQPSLTPSTRAKGSGAVGRILDLELAIMLHAFREDLLAQKARAERLMTFGQLSASIGRELRQPLNEIERAVQLLRAACTDAKELRHVERIHDQVELASGIVSGLLDMVQDTPLHLEAVVLARVLHDALALVRQPRSLALHLEGLATLPPVRGDPRQLRQAFANLLDNAMQAALPSAPEVWITGAVEPARVLVAVEDNGPGVSPSIRARLFEPLMTSKPNGTGLGLPLVQRIIVRHGGEVSYEPGARGARFAVRLPS